MPSKPSESLLFHKKKKPVKKDGSGTPPNRVPSASSPRKSATPRQQPTPPDADTEDNTKLPEGEFAEYKLMSSALNGWKYDIMKFSSHNSIDITTWDEPIKLNRKEIKRDEVAAPPQQAAGPMLGPDGKPVVGPDGKVVMVDAEGKPMMNNNNAGEAHSSKDKDVKGKGPANGKKRFQKKTRQVFMVSEESRQLKKDEKYPWVMEDARENEVWVGRMDDAARAEIHGLFMPAAREFFKFVPAHRWYKFQKRPNHPVLTLQEAEAVMSKIQKNKDPHHWLSQNRAGKAPSAATAAMFKAEPDSGPSGSSLVHNAGQSRGPGGRKLISVHRGSRNDDDEEGGGRKRKEEDEGEGDVDENLFEEEPADDDEQEAAADDDEEAKETEERLKREYKAANKQRDGQIDESDDDLDDSQLTQEGKSLKKLMRDLEKNMAYDSDDERKNPYASSEDESEEEPPVVTDEPAIQQQPQQVKSRASSPNASQPAPTRTQNTPASGSRPTSPAPPSGLGGHSVVAKRATSPKAPKLKSANVSRANSPLSSHGAGSRATSPVANSRATSPAVKSPTSPTASNSASLPKPANKRKATDDPVGSGQPSGSQPNGSTGAPKPKRRKPLPPGPSASGELEENMLVEWLQNAAEPTTRNCIRHFTAYLTTDAQKSKFAVLVKQVATMKKGVLVLKSATPEGASHPSSPAP